MTLAPHSPRVIHYSPELEAEISALSSAIAQVPALVYIPEVNGGEPLVVFGDSSIGYALELMARETGSRELGHLAERLVPIP